MRTLKKTTITAAFIISLGISSIACAATDYTPTEEHGFYLGLGAGFLTLNNAFDIDGTITDAEGNEKTESVVTNSGNTGFNSFLVGGYSWKFVNRLFLAGEIFGNLTNTSTPTEIIQSNSKKDIINNIDVTLQSVYGVRALPGYQVADNAVIYGIAGWARANAESTDTLTSTKNDKNNLEDNGTLNFNGYQLGLGSMLDITEHLALRADLIYTGYGQQTVGDAEKDKNNGGKVEATATADPSTWEGDIGLVYSF